MRFVILSLSLFLGAFSVQAATPDTDSPFDSQQQEEEGDDVQDDDVLLHANVAPAFGFVPRQDATHQELIPQDIYPAPMHRPPAA